MFAEFAIYVFVSVWQYKMTLLLLQQNPGCALVLERVFTLSLVVLCILPKSTLAIILWFQTSKSMKRIKKPGIDELLVRCKVFTCNMFIGRSAIAFSKQQCTTKIELLIV